MSYTTQTQITGQVNVIFQMRLLESARPMCPYFVGSEQAVIQSHGGTNVASWRRINNLTPKTTALTALNGSVSYPTRTASQASETNVTATLAKYGDFIILNEEVQLYSYDAVNDRYAVTLGIQAGQSLNRLQRNEMEDNSTAILVGGAASAADIVQRISKLDIRNAVNTLERNSGMKFTVMTTGDSAFNTSPIMQSYWGICHTDVQEDIRDMQGFISVESYAGQTEVAPGEFGTVGRVRWLASEESTIDAEAGGTSTGTGLRTSGNSKVDVYNSVIFARGAFGSVGLDIPQPKEVYMAGDKLPTIMPINKPRGSGGTADPLDEISTLGWKAFHAAAVLNTSWSRNVRSGASALSS